MLHRYLQQYVCMLTVYTHIHCRVCMHTVCTYTKVVQFHSTSQPLHSLLTYVCRQHWGAPHTPDDGLDDKVLDGFPNGVSVQVQLCSHVLPERKESPVWRGGGGRGEGMGEGREWEKGERKGTCTNIRTHMYVCTYIRMQWHMHSHMRTNGHIVHQQTSYECVRTYVCV